MLGDRIIQRVNDGYRLCPITPSCLKTSKVAQKLWLIFILIIGIGLLGFYEPAHAVDGPERGFVYAAEGCSSELAGLIRSNIRISKSEREPRDSGGGCGGDRRCIKDVSSIPEDGIQKVVRGAVVFSILIGFVYLVCRR